ncbi:MAG: hypothetical protein RL375_778 [Pseudomonadota bacterium]
MIKTTALAIAIAVLLCWFGPSLDDHSDEWDQAVYLQDAINVAIEQKKFAVAAQALCGPQAAWAQLADGSVQCKTKHGRPTITVMVSP